MKNGKNAQKDFGICFFIKWKWLFQKRKIRGSTYLDVSCLIPLRFLLDHNLVSPFDKPRMYVHRPKHSKLPDNEIHYTLLRTPEMLVPKPFPGILGPPIESHPFQTYQSPT